jgi:spoIIIJ-associated protein
METNKIQEIIEHILNHLSVEATVSVVRTTQGSEELLTFAIETKEPYLLVGENGKILMSLNHVVKKVCEAQCAKQLIPQPNFIVDVNNYQEKKMQDIKNKAKIMAERARFFKSDVELTPMNPYERMIVHTFFSDTNDISTESTGYGKDRRVVIKYVQS